MKKEIYIHSDESDEFIGRLVQTFGISFEELGLYSGMLFQELIDNIISKVGLQSVNDCTTQIAFYKVRRIIVEEFGVEKGLIKNNTLIKEIFPKRNRKENLLLISKRLEIKIDYFQPPIWLQVLSTTALISSIVLLFFSFFVGLVTFIVTVLLFFISNKLRTRLPMKTIGELVEKMTRDNLIKLRGDKESINPKEVRITIIKLIDDLHGLDKLELNSEQKIIFG